MWDALLCAFACVALTASPATSAELRGQYLEARTCDVYTGPCFANAELGLAGKEAVMAWKVDSGAWQGTQLDGLCVAVVLKADASLGDDGVFPMKAKDIESVILVDEQANAEQHEALVNFARETASRYTANVQKVAKAPMSLENNHDTGRGHFVAGKTAEIETRALGKGDCVCTNEMVFFQPLTDVAFASPVYTLTQSYRGDGLDGRWTLNSTRSAFMGAFGR
jgi:hypothetical protein